MIFLQNKQNKRARRVPPKTELAVQPTEKTMEGVPQLFATLKQHAIGEKWTRPEFVDANETKVKAASTA